jgi:transcriptional regulator with XRE-family HTH domain
MLYGAQLRAGRALLGWRQEDLAKKADVGLATLQRIEQGAGPVSGNAKTIWKLQTALEKAGVRLVGGESHGATVGVTRAVS